MKPDPNVAAWACIVCAQVCFVGDRDVAGFMWSAFALWVVVVEFVREYRRSRKEAV